MTQPCPPARKIRQPRSQNSDIRGIGYGDWHAWENVETARVGSAPAEYKWTRYECRACGAEFKHYYDVKPNIFDTMKVIPVPAECHPKSKESNVAQKE
jgi:hypothetical protein